MKAYEIWDDENQLSIESYNILIKSRDILLNFRRIWTSGPPSLFYQLC